MYEICVRTVCGGSGVLFFEKERCSFFNVCFSGRTCSLEEKEEY